VNVKHNKRAMREEEAKLLEKVLKFVYIISAGLTDCVYSTFPHLAANYLYLFLGV
jgi:hypothetical protein